MKRNEHTRTVQSRLAVVEEYFGANRLPTGAETETIANLRLSAAGRNVIACKETQTAWVHTAREPRLPVAPIQEKADG